MKGCDRKQSTTQ